MKKQKRENKLKVACRCGHVQLTAAMCAFKCEKLEIGSMRIEREIFQGMEDLKTEIEGARK